MGEGADDPCLPQAAGSGARRRAGGCPSSAEPRCRPGFPPDPLLGPCPAPAVHGPVHVMSSAVGCAPPFLVCCDVGAAFRTVHEKAILFAVMPALLLWSTNPRLVSWLCLAALFRWALCLLPPPPPRWRPHLRVCACLCVCLCCGAATPSRCAYACWQPPPLPQTRDLFCAHPFVCLCWSVAARPTQPSAVADEGRAGNSVPGIPGVRRVRGAVVPGLLLVSLRHATWAV